MAFSMLDWFGNTYVGGLVGMGGKNSNRFISPADFKMKVMRLDKSEEWTSINGKEREIYLTTPELRMVVDRLALMFANGMWKHYNEDGTEVENSEIVRFLENPNIHQSRNQFLFQWFVQRCLYPATYTYKLIGSRLADVPTALWNLPPQRMVVERTGKIWTATTPEEIINRYRLKNENADEFFYPYEIIQMARPDCDDPIMGVSPLMALKMPISNIRAAYGYRNAILTKKGAIGVWSSDAKDSMGSIQLTPDEVDDVTAQLLDTYGIFDDQHKVAISPKALKWNPATYPTKELMLFEEVDSNRKAIIDIMGGNEFMFCSGVNAKGSTFTNVEMGEKLCYQDTIVPIAEDYSYSISKSLGLPDKRQYVCLEYDHLPIMQFDRTKEAEVSYKKTQAVDILVRNGYQTDDAMEIIGLDAEGYKATTPKPVTTTPGQQ